MDIANSFKQLKAYARIEGAILGVIWVASFAFLVYMPQSLWGNLIILSTPFYAGWRIKTFETRFREGFISFKAAYLFSAYTFFYASLIFAACLFIYFQWLDSSAFMNLFDQNNSNCNSYLTNNWEWTLASCKKAMKLIREMSAIDITFTILYAEYPYRNSSKCSACSIL